MCVPEIGIEVCGSQGLEVDEFSETDSQALLGKLASDIVQDIPECSEAIEHIVEFFQKHEDVVIRCLRELFAILTFPHA